MATPSKPRDVDKLAREVSRDNTPDSPVVQALRRQTANAFVLYANYKHYHWQTFGPLFRDLHKLFDELANEVLSTVDELERVRMIGQDPPAHLLNPPVWRVSVHRRRQYARWSMKRSVTCYRDLADAQGRRWPRSTPTPGPSISFEGCPDSREARVVVA